MLGVMRVTAWVASVVSLVLAIVLAILVYGMPLGQALLAGTEGAAFGFFPILWIVINAIWVYQMTVETGHFGALQVTAANQAGLSDVLMAASNSSGGVLGKMISPQNLAIAAAAVGMNGKEGDIFRRVVVWSVVFLALLCVLSALQSSVLSWMVA
jgi:lactate permease